MQNPLRILVVLAAASTLARGQDSLQLTDGRFVVDRPMTRVDDGIVVHFEAGDVKVPNAMVKASTARTATETKDPTPEEQAHLDKGEVFFEGRWILTERRDTELARRRAIREKKIAEAKEHRRWAKHYVTKTANFEFHYTIDPDVMQGYADLMETYFREFTKEWGIKKPSKAGRLTVCFYHDDETFHQVGGAPAGVIGYYRFVEPRELNFYYDRLDQDMTQDVMFHETNHYLTHLIDLSFNYPPWVNESLAEYYGASEWDPVKKKMTVGVLQEGRLAVVQDAVKADEWQGLEDLIRKEHGAFTAIHYAWGWSFVHFLLSSDRYAKGFKAFYLALARDKSIKRTIGNFEMKKVEPDEQIRALLSYLRVDSLSVLEKEWHDYIRTLQPATDRGFLEAGQIALSRSMPIKAQRLFKTALEMGCQNPLANYGYAQSLEQKSKLSEALEQYDLALAKDPLEAMFYVRKAQCLERSSKEQNKQEITRLFLLASEIAPDAYDVMLAKAMWEFRDDDK